MRGKKLLITGPAGQIAFPLAEELAQHNEVWGIARFSEPGSQERCEKVGVRTVVCDLAKGDFSALPDDFDYLLHLATFQGGGLDYDQAIRVNAEGTGLLMQHCRKAKAALVVSTFSTYKPNDDPHHLHKETDPLGDVNSPHAPTYSMSKIAEEAVARTMARILNLPTTIARMNASYSWNGGLPAYHLDWMMNDQEVALRAPGSTGYNPIDQADINAQVPKLCDIATVPATVVNWAGDDMVTPEIWCAYFAELTGKTPRFTYREYPGASKGGASDNTKRIELIGKCEVGWKEGFKKMWEQRYPGGKRRTDMPDGAAALQNSYVGDALKPDAVMDVEVSAEHSPMSGIDEYLIHNYPHPVRVMWTSDPRAYERLWFTAQDKVGEVFFVCGLGFYPNLGTAEAYALVNHNGVHHSVHAHRKLGDDRTNMKIGPFEFEIVEPFRQWHISLADNEFGLSYDLEWYDTKRAVFQQLGAGMIHNGRVGGNTAGYESFGEQSGTISVAGASITLERDGFCGSRDHHWGVRDGVGGPKHWMGSKWPMSGQWVEFRDWSLWSPRVLYNIGDPRQGAGATVHREHRIRFEPDTKIPISGEIDVYLPDGSRKLLTFERLGNQIGFLRCGMYGGINGGTPVGDIWHGMDVGETVMGETHDANDPAVRSAITGQDNLHCRFECDGEVAYGIVEPVTPVCYEFAKAGMMGFSIIE